VAEQDQSGPAETVTMLRDLTEAVCTVAARLLGLPEEGA
jgi:hypothetical protein